jgi:hypothetical protein
MGQQRGVRRAPLDEFERRRRRRDPLSMRELVTDIMSYLAERNLQPRPYRWKAKGEQILRKIQRAREALAAQEAAAGYHLI